MSLPPRPIHPLCRRRPSCTTTRSFSPPAGSDVRLRGVSRHPRRHLCPRRSRECVPRHARRVGVSLGLSRHSRVVCRPSGPHLVPGVVPSPYGTRVSVVSWTPVLRRGCPLGVGLRRSRRGRMWSSSGATPASGPCHVCRACVPRVSVDAILLSQVSGPEVDGDSPRRFETSVVPRPLPSPSPSGRWGLDVSSGVWGVGVGVGSVRLPSIGPLWGL